MTAPIITLVPRPRGNSRGLRFVLGSTTKSDILALAPDANIGVGVVDGVEDERDIHWVLVPTKRDSPLAGDAYVQPTSGEWIVEHPDGTFDVLTHDEARAQYEFEWGI